MGVVKTIEVKANLKDAEKNFQELNEQLKIQKDVLIDLEKQIYDVEKAQRSTSKTNLGVQKKLADKAKELKNELKSERIGLRELNSERSASISQITNLSNAQANSSKIVKGLDKFTGGYASKLKKVFLGAKEAAKGIKVFVSGLSGVKKALIATGVGALVVGLVTVVAYWDDIKKLIGGASVELEKQEEKIRNQISKQETQISLIESQLKLEKLKTGEGTQFTKELKKQLLIQQEQNKELQKNLENQLKLSKGKKGQREAEVAAIKAIFGQKTAKGLLLKVEAEEEKIIKKINEVKKQSIGIEIKLAQIDAEVIKKKKKNREEQEKAKKKKDEEELKAEKEKAAAIERIRKGLIDTEDERRKEELRKIKSDYDEQIKLAEQYYGKESQTILDLKEAQKNTLNEQQSKFDEQDKKKAEEKSKIAADKLVLEKEDELLSFDEQRKIINERQRLLISDETITEEDKNTLLKQFSDARETIVEKENEAKLISLNGYASALSGISSVIGQETAAGKSIAVASSLINTYASITGQLKAFSGIPVPGYAIAQAIATGVVGFANVKKIVSTKVPKSSGGGGGSVGSPPSGGSVSQPPSFNVVGASDTNQLADAIGSQSQEPTRAYVVSNDVTTAQSMDRNIVDGASI